MESSTTLKKRELTHQEKSDQPQLKTKKRVATMSSQEQELKKTPIIDADALADIQKFVYPLDLSVSVRPSTSCSK